MRARTPLEARGVLRRDDFVGEAAMRFKERSCFYVCFLLLLVRHLLLLTSVALVSTRFRVLDGFGV